MERGFWLCGENNEKGYFAIYFENGTILSSAGTSENIVIVAYDIIKKIKEEEMKEKMMNDVTVEAVHTHTHTGILNNYGVKKEVESTEM